MKGNRVFVWAALGALLIATGALASFDSPAGIGFDFPQNKAGIDLTGFATVALRDYHNSDLSAGSFEGVALLQRKKELHTFHAEYSCGTSDPCGVCINGRVDATNGVGIALCLTELIQPEVLSDFNLGALDVRLHSASEFVSEVDPSNPNLRLAAALIDLTAN